MGNITGEVDRLLFSLPLVALNRLVEFQISLSEPFFFFFKLELLVGSLSSEMKMCFERRGKLNRLLSKLYFKLVGGLFFRYVVPGVGSNHSVCKLTVFVSGLTDEEVQLAIQHAGSTEEVLPLTPVGLPQPVHAAQLVPVPHSESQSHTLCVVGGPPSYCY